MSALAQTGSCTSGLSFSRDYPRRGSRCRRLNAYHLRVVKLAECCCLRFFCKAYLFLLVFIISN
jgi:hypothetical protein